MPCKICQAPKEVAMKLVAKLKKKKAKLKMKMLRSLPGTLPSKKIAKLHGKVQRNLPGACQAKTIIARKLSYGTKSACLAPIQAYKPPCTKKYKRGNT